MAENASALGGFSQQKSWQLLIESSEKEPQKNNHAEQSFLSERISYSVFIKRYLYPTDSVKSGYGVYQNQDSVYLGINAFTENPQTDVLLGFSFNKKNIAVGSSYQITDLLSIPDLLPASYLIIEPVMVHITELGAPEQYIKGNFSELLQSKMVPDLMLKYREIFVCPRRFKIGFIFGPDSMNKKVH